MKKYSFLAVVLLMVAFVSCSSVVGDKKETAASGLKEGAVNQISTEMFRTLVYDNQKTPTEWIYPDQFNKGINFLANA